MDEPTVERDIISPEGLDERVQVEYIFRATLTQGGKFRQYGLCYRDGKGEVTTPTGVGDTIEEAEGSLAMGMLVLAAKLLGGAKAVSCIPQLYSDLADMGAPPNAD